MEKQKEKMGKLLRFPVNKKTKRTGYKMPKIYKLLLILNMAIMVFSVLALFYMKKLI